MKETSKTLLSGKAKMAGLEYLVGRGKGWMWNGSGISLHQLEAFVVYYLFKDKNINKCK
ncbi:MAG: hypothetical protein LBR43_03265 [Spiroplasmataceae bacterium]|nr:hypothetical protein [Spiroplasmataceae bacterium]